MKQKRKSNVFDQKDPKQGEKEKQKKKKKKENEKIA